MTPALVRDEATALVAESLWFGERIVVLGATGWFGSTMLALLERHPAPVLPVASRARAHRVGERTWSVAAYDVERVVEFAPTVVLDFAYLTRGHDAALGTAEYAHRLDELARRLDRIARLPSVRAVLTISSGAAIAVPEGPTLPVGVYGEGKRAVEAVAAGLVDPARGVVVARTYSVSGTLVGAPHAYALSEFVRQVRACEIAVQASTEVWLRYCGVDDYLAKTFQTEELIARLRPLIRRASANSSSELIAGDVRLDTRSGRVTLNGEPVKLTAQEYKLLSYLLHHKGKVVSRTELIEHIYDQDFDRDSNTIEVFVTRIRKKLGPDVITTIRGLGYSLDDPAHPGRG